MMTRLIAGFCLCLSLLGGSLLFSDHADAVACPAASIATVCAELTEGTVAGGVIGSTVITMSRDGVALAPVTILASSSAGGQVQSTSLSTVECQSDTYSATALTNYTIGGVPFKSLVVSATPGAGVVKNRTAEAVCTVQPGNFTVR